MKTILRFTIILTILSTAICLSKAQKQPDLPIIEVTDTLCNLACQNNGTSTGVQFLPDGNSIIVIWEGKPLVIDAYSGEIIRRLDTIPNSDIANPKVSKDGTKLIATRLGPKFEVWDIPSGKILEMSEDIISRFCISPDGNKIYCTKWNDPAKPGIISEYNTANWECTETFCTGFRSAGDISVSPDGQTLAVEVIKDPENENDTNTTQIILIDLNDKTKYSVLESMEPIVNPMDFSPDGKHLAYAYVAVSPDIYICIYNLETKVKKCILQSEIELLLGKGSFFGNPKFLSNDILLLASSPSNLTWSLSENVFKKIINFNAAYTDVNGNRILFCGHKGALAILDYEHVSVRDNPLSDNSYVVYQNNQLEYYSMRAIAGESCIYDLSGKLVSRLGARVFANGKNSIPLNRYLQAGIYILTVNNGMEYISKKFIVQ